MLGGPLDADIPQDSKTLERATATVQALVRNHAASKRAQNAVRPAAGLRHVRDQLLQGIKNTGRKRRPASRSGRTRTPPQAPPSPWLW
eukprot:9022567-Pyramimonas_sp.AAC.1